MPIPSMYRPKNTYDLVQRIKSEIKERGVQCDLNHLDVSHLTSLQAVFMNSDFNGDISRWNVARVEQMSGMFQGSQFKGDLSRWRPVALKEAYEMFRDCPFQGDLSTWELPALRPQCNNMVGFPFFGKLPNWHDQAMNTTYWKTFHNQYPDKFLEFVGTWEMGHAIRPSLALADLLVGPLAQSAGPHASPSLNAFCEQYQAGRLVVGNLGIDDAQTAFDMLAQHMHPGQQPLVYHVPFEAA